MVNLRARGRGPLFTFSKVRRWNQYKKNSNLGFGIFTWFFWLLFHDKILQQILKKSEKLMKITKKKKNNYPYNFRKKYLM